MIKREQLRFKELINEILDKLPVELFISDNTTFLDPAFACGQFLHEISLRLLQYGHTKENIKTRLYGIESNKLNLYLIKNYHGIDGNFYYGDFCKDKYLTNLNNDTLEIGNMKFNCIIGNPPYGNGKNSSFYIEFVKKTNALINDNGYVSLVIPNRFCIPNSKLTALLNKLHILEITNNVSDNFPTISNNVFIGYYIGKKKSTKEIYNSNVLCNFKDFVLHIDLNSVFLPTQKINIQLETLSILKKIVNYHNKCVISKIETNNCVWIQRQFKFCNKKVEVGQILKFNIINCKNNDGKFFVLDTNDKKENFKKFIYESKLMTFYSYCFSGSVNCIPIVFQNIPKLDFSKEWSNDDLYKEFDLTLDEILYLEKLIQD